MADPNPFDQFDNSIGRPVIRKGQTPVAPTEVFHPMTEPQRRDYGIPGGVPAIINDSGKPEVVNLPNTGDKTTYRPMTSDEKKGAGLDTTQPFYLGSNGLPAIPTGAKGGSAPVDTEQARAHVSTILQSIDQATKLLDEPLTSGLPGSIFGHIPGTNAYALRSLIGDTNDPNNPGQITGDLRQQGISYLRALNGGNGVGTVARSQQEQQALQAAMSNIRQGLPSDQLKEALGNVKQIYLRSYARSYGLDPENPQVQHQFGIDGNYQLPGLAPQMPATPEGPPKDNGITTSNQPPALVGKPQEGISSGDTESVVNPKLAAIAPQLEKYLAADPAKVSNAMILGFMQKNGVSPTETTIMPVLQYRTSKDGAAWRAQGGNYGVDPRQNVPLTGVKKAAATVTGAIPAATAAVAGAADTATLGTIPDAAGVIHAVTGLGPSRSDAVNARDNLASAEPGATLAGNLAGSFLPLGASGEASAASRALRTTGSGAAYGFFGSDDPRIQSRAFNSGLGAIIAGLTHGATDAGGRLAQTGYRGVARPIENLLFGTEPTADKYALNAAARKMPIQNVEEVKAANAASNATGVPTPAAASLSRAGQDSLARTASGSPAARAVVDQVAEQTRSAIPKEIAGDFNSAIEAAAPRGVDSSAYLNRPVREIADDVQGMAGREYEKGLAPIAKQKLTITPEIAGDLDHERVVGAVKDALANHNLDPDTRDELRQLIPQLKSLNSAPEMARSAYAKGIPLSVDSARNVATALDRTANRLMDGSEGRIELSRLSRDIRGAIGDQFPEYGPVNARYASRMRAIGAMHDARTNFFASTPDQADALAKASKRFTDTPNEAEYGVATAQPTKNGFVVDTGPKVLPSNRQFATAGAREAASVQAGENGGATAQRISGNANQQANNRAVMGSGAGSVEAKTGQRAKNAETVDRIASAGTGDQTERWFDTAKRLIALKATGGTAHYALAHAAASVPGLSSKDAGRVVRLYLDADSAPQVLQSLTKAYGARRARFVMARIASMTATASGIRGFQAKAQ